MKKSTTALITWLTDPETYAVNRIAAHSDHRRFSHFPAENESSDLTQSLDGTWAVRVTDASATALPDISDVDSCADFHEIAVPGHLEMAGQLRPQYINIAYPWSGHEAPTAPNIPDANHVAIYTRNFTPNATMAGTLASGGHVHLTFQGAATAIYVWLNGIFIGYAEDSFTPSEFDVTDALQTDAPNKLIVACYEFSSASWLEDQDFWRLHGLFRSVELSAIPAAHVQDIRAVADWQVSSGQGILNCDLTIAGAQTADMCEISLSDSAGSEVWSASRTPAKTLHIEATIDDIAPWSAESPTLYTLTCALKGSDGETIEVSQTKLGFRHVEIIDNVLTLNGRRLVLKGVNRHEFNKRTGRAISKQDMLEDIKTLKRLNINAVRTSHYPNQSLWYELCDEYGIYLIDETNLETHGSWCSPGDVPVGTSIPGGDLRWEPACLDRIDSMVTRDRNHASVLIWSLGNESFAGDVIASMGQRARELDSTRPVHYEGVTQNRTYDAISDFESRMYAKPAEIREYLESGHVPSSPAKPFVSCEYMHAMGNSCGGLSEYVKLERYEQYAGGFIWDYIDQALEQVQPDGSTRLAIGGEWGDRPSDYEFSGDGIVFADRTLSPKAQEVKQLYANVRIYPDARGAVIENRNAFISTSGYVFTARLLEDGCQTWSADYRIDIPAGHQERLPIAFPEHASAQTDVVYEVDCRLAHSCPWAPAGYEVCFGQSAVKVSERMAGAEERPTSTTPGAALNEASAVVSADPWNTGIRSGNSEAIFSATQGGIVSWTRDGRQMVIRRPDILTFRPLTDNDRGNHSGFDRACWFGAGRYAQPVKTEIVENNGILTATYDYQLADPQNTLVRIRYSIGADMRLHLTAEFAGVGSEASLPTIPCFGLEWELPNRCSFLRWYGLGPEETYVDRQVGGKLGIWQTTAAESLAPYLMAQETGNHIGTRWAEITDEHGHGLRVQATGGTTFEHSLLPASTYAIEAARRMDEVPTGQHTYLRLLAAQMGVGGDDSWGAPVHQQYLLPSDQPLTLDCEIELI